MIVHRQQYLHRGGRRERLKLVKPGPRACLLHNAGIAVLRGIRKDGESADHLALDHVVQHAPRGIRTLLRQDAEVVAVIRYSSRTDLVSFRRGLRGQFAQRATVAIR